MNNYKVLGYDGTDRDFETHQEAFHFIKGLNTYPKVLYRIIDKHKLGELNVFGSFWDTRHTNLLNKIHKDKNYQRVVI